MFDAQHLTRCHGGEEERMPDATAQAIESVAGMVVAVVFILAMCTDFFNNIGRRK
jgi:hypothetical protein